MVSAGEVVDLTPLLALAGLRRVELAAEGPPEGDTALAALQERGVEVAYTEAGGAGEGEEEGPDVAAIMGTGIAFASKRDGYYDLYLLLPDGTERKLTDLDGHEQPPAWSPDGRHLAFVAWGWGVPAADICVMSRDGDLKRFEIAELTKEWDPSWTADGQEIVFSGRPSGEDDNGAFGPVWHPEGHVIAFCRTEDGHIWIADVDEGTAVDLRREGWGGWKGESTEGDGGEMIDGA